MGRAVQVPAEERYDRLLDAVEAAPGQRAKDFGRLEQYAHVGEEIMRTQLARDDLRAMEKAGELTKVRRKGPTGQTEYTYYLFGTDTGVPPESAEEDTVLAPPEPVAPPWTLEELRYWLAASEEAPGNCLVARSFERNRRRAVEAVEEAIYQRDAPHKVR